MKKLIPYLIIAFFGCLACGDKVNSTNKSENISSVHKNEKVKHTYPETRKDAEIVEDYHGTEVKDPYRWLEDDHSEETIDWVKRQNKLTYNYLENLPGRKTLIDRLTDLWNYPKYSSPFKKGDKYYFYKNDGLQNQSALYEIDKLDSKPRLVLDPNKFSEDGTSSLAGVGFNKEANLMAYMVSEGGSDWRTIRILDVKSLKVLEDKIEWAKFSSISWYRDGFFYSRYPEPSEDGELSNKNEYHKLYYHKLGDKQSKDQLIHEEPAHPQRNTYANVSDDESFLFASISESTSGNALKIRRTTENRFKDIVTEFKDDFNVIDNIESSILIQTNHEAPNNQVILVDYEKPAKKNWKVLVPESTDPIRSVSIIDNKMFIGYLKDASSLVKVFDMKGNFIQDLALPGIGTCSGISGDKDSNVGFYSFTSFTQPSTIFKLDAQTLESSVFRRSEIDFDVDQYITKQEWYTSKDGTKVPMFIVHKKGLKMDGSNPTLLYGYGGFDISILPSFSITKLPLLENGGIFAVANIRGGGEFGADWHKAGTLDQKQNVFDDFIAAGEYLVENKYTSPSKLAIQGGSNGGLLVGACMTQRPDLFGVCFPAVGVLDMLRYHEFTIGWAWATDYGRSDDPEAFKYLKAYSPLHNVKEIDYPATLVTTADHDDRVVPAHSFKFAAELQSKHTGADPVMIRIETSAGHGAGKPTSMRIEEAADILAFMFNNMNEEINYKNTELSNSSSK